MAIQACQIHGGNIVDRKLLHEHHVIPRGVGGVDDPTNTIWICASCHDLLHRIAHMFNSGKAGLAKDLALQYLPAYPAGRQKLLEYATTAANAMRDFIPDFDEENEDDTVVVQLHIPRRLHHQLKTCASNYRNQKSGRKMGLYNYVVRVLKSHVKAQLSNPGKSAADATYAVTQPIEEEAPTEVKNKFGLHELF